MKRKLRVCTIILAMIAGLAFSVTSVSAASYGDYSYKSTLSGIEITGYNGKAKNITIPDKIDDKPVTAIGEDAFAGKLSIETVTIPSTVTRIDDYAFESCGRLNTVKLPSSLETIGYGAFSGCGKLTNLVLPQGLKTIEACAFYCCRSVETLSLPASVNAIGYSAFSGCSIKELTIPDDTALTSIGDRVFYNNEIKNIVIPAASSIKKLGKESFANSTKLESVSIDGVEEIGEGCFQTSVQNTVSVSIANARKIESKAFEGYSLTSITLEEGVEYIGKEAFNYTGDAVDIPSTVTTIEGGAFSNCGVENLNIAAGNTSYKSVDGVIYSADGKTLVAMPNRKSVNYSIVDGTETIGPYAFKNCGLITLTIPSSVTSIGIGAFQEFRLTGEGSELAISANVTSIGDSAFSNANIPTLKINTTSISTLGKEMFKESTINNLVLPSNLTEIKEDAFFGSNVNVTIPSSVTTVANGAFLKANGLIATQESGSFSIVDTHYLVKGGIELVAYLSQGNTQSEPTIPSGIKKIDSYAIVSNFIEKTVININAPVETIEKYGLGFRGAQAGYLNYDLKNYNENLVIYSDVEEVQDYARTNGISCFTGTPSQNISSVTLAGDESANFTITNARAKDVTYTSADKSIATVDDNGVITAQRKGTVSIVAAVGFTYFECIVTVTSDSANPYEPEFDESRFHAVEKSEYNQWFNEYLKYNDGDLPNDNQECVYITRYKSSAPEYFKAMWAVECNDPLFISRAENLFGKGFEETASLMSHGLKYELSNYYNNDDLVLYSGTYDLDIITGITPNISDLRNLEGNDYEFEMTTSTSIDETVAVGFGDYVIIVYADKEAIGGGYIENIASSSGGGEYELLMYGGLNLTLLEAGVRHIKAEPFEDNKETVDRYERYVKFYLSKDKNPQRIKQKSKEPTVVDTSDGNDIEIYIVLVIVAIIVSMVVANRRKVQ